MILFAWSIWKVAELDMNNQVLNTAVIGYGIVGQMRRSLVDNHPDMKTVAVCDIRFRHDGILKDLGTESDYTQLEHDLKNDIFTFQLSDGVVAYNDFDYMLNDIKLDVVFVCLPNYLAPEVTMCAIKKDIHVFCEKPPGRNVQDIKDIISSEILHPDVKLKFGFNHRYHDSVMQAKSIIESGEYGEVINYRGVYGKSRIIPFSGGWRSELKYAGGGILLDQGIHMLDMVKYFSGEFNQYKSFISNSYWNHDVEDNAYIMMKNDSGCVAMIHSTATQWQHRFRLEISLREATLELTGLLTNSKSYGEEKLRIVQRKDHSITGTGDLVEYSFLDDRSWKREIDDFVDIIKNNKKVENGNSLDALAVMSMIQNIYEADDTWHS